MTEIYNLFRGLVVIVFVGVCVWGVAQIIPQAQSAATLPARIESENARILQEAQAAPTFVALSVVGTRAAIENEQMRARAESQAQTIAAQGIADGERARGNAIQSAVWGIVGVIAFGIASFVLFAVVRSAFAQRTHSNAIREASRVGGRLELPDGQAVTFEPRAAPKQLPSGQTSLPVARAESSRVGKRR